jgi:hypothetical protein
MKVLCFGFRESLFFSPLSSPSLPFSFLLLSRSSQRAALLGGCAAGFY